MADSDMLVAPKVDYAATHRVEGHRSTPSPVLISPDRVSVSGSLGNSGEAGH